MSREVGSSPDYEDEVRNILSNLEEEAQALGELALTAADDSPLLTATHEGITECMQGMEDTLSEFNEPTRGRLFGEALG
ncbi:MAG TPA: hypothetical protein VFT53_00280 [Candidatus Saccharimonadales bacterium]|nr:hypothetical protein [Candidatus Saccharimonadales bacterium]